MDRSKWPPLTDYVIPLLTPFRRDLTIDFDAVAADARHVMKLPACGGLYLGSVYQEFWTLSMNERKALSETVVDVSRDITPVVVGVSSTNVATSLELALHAEDAGATMLMLWPPLFGPRSDESVLEFHKLIANSVSLPLHLQHDTEGAWLLIYGPDFGAVG